MIEQEEKTKRPTFLVVLVVLSMISLVLTFFSSLLNLMSGPMQEEVLETFTATQYESIAVLRDLGSDGMANFLEQIIQMSVYQNNEIFVSSNGVSFIASILGIIGVMMMYRLRKLGFHLYVIYSLSPFVIYYLLFPISLIPTVMVIGSFIISLIFVLLYARFLKLME